nr:MAG: hypothetical protein 2 [Tombusvirus sp.]
MERAIQGDDAGEPLDSKCWDGGCGSSITPFQFYDETPCFDEWRLHNNEKTANNYSASGFEESWSFGKVVFKRHYRYDGTEASLDRALRSWTGDSVNNASHRFFGADQIGCTYSIRFRGPRVSVSGGSRTILDIIEMAIWTKFKVLQLTHQQVEGAISRGCLDGKAIKTESE